MLVCRSAKYLPFYGVGKFGLRVGQVPVTSSLSGKSHARYSVHCQCPKTAESITLRYCAASGSHARCRRKTMCGNYRSLPQHRSLTVGTFRQQETSRLIFLWITGESYRTPRGRSDQVSEKIDLFSIWRDAISCLQSRNLYGRICTQLHSPARTCLKVEPSPLARRRLLVVVRPDIGSRTLTQTARNAERGIFSTLTTAHVQEKAN